VELDRAAAGTRRAAKGTRPHRRVNSTAPPHLERKAKQRVCIGARQGRRSASGQPPLINIGKAEGQAACALLGESVDGRSAPALLPRPSSLLQSLYFSFSFVLLLYWTAMAFGSGSGKRRRSEDDEDIHADGEDIQPGFASLVPSHHSGNVVPN
jgi:hypothetical protein